MVIWRSRRWCRPYTVPLKSKLPVASRFLRDENRVARESSNRKVLGRQCWILDSTPCIWDSGYWYSIPYSLKLELGFQIPIVNGILDSLSCITDFTSKTSRIPGSGRHGICFAALGPS